MCCMVSHTLSMSKSVPMRYHFLPPARPSPRINAGSRTPPVPMDGFRTGRPWFNGEYDSASLPSLRSKYTLGSSPRKNTPRYPTSPFLTDRSKPEFAICRACRISRSVLEQYANAHSFCSNVLVEKGCIGAAAVTCAAPSSACRCRDCIHHSSACTTLVAFLALESSGISDRAGIN